MFKLNTFLVLFLVVGLAVVPVKAEDELPVEIDMQLMSKTMTMEQAESKLQGDIEKYRLKKKEATKAQEALGKLVKEGISVNRACEEVCEAVRSRKRKRIEEVAEEGNIKRIKTQLAKEDIETQIRKRTEEDIETAVEVVEELIEKGVAVEKARNAVNKTIKEGGDRVQLREMLESEAVREMKQETIRERTRTNEDVVAERAQKENVGESKGPDSSNEDDSGNRKGKR